ncbi:carbohydrate porin [Acidovorax sp. FG27]|uniref:carbohydrate porin n=1 Tax=Acidovorax sp. FG27 TaxID=3133652 RepID=UPI0030E9EE07
MRWNGGEARRWALGPGAAVLVAVACAPMAARAQAAQAAEVGQGAQAVEAVEAVKVVDAEPWTARFQSTYVWQGKRPFAAAYSGPRSLSPDKERSYSFTATAFLGVRAWQGGELYFNPEAAQGVPLSNLTGLGGLTNGEMARTSGSELKFYRARLFLRQTWGLGGGQEAVDPGPNQLAGMVDKRRLVLTAGNLSVTDVFDANAYSHDPRTQFLNWSVMTHGAYDFAADARGYTWGAALEWQHDDWALRAGRFIQPRQPNQQQLDHDIFRHYGDQIELEHAHTLAGRPGTVRLLAFHNRARMSRFADALDLAARTGAVPDIDAVRTGAQGKGGFGVNIEQAATDDVGLFLRASRADGKTETYAFTEIERSLSGGVLVKGTAWGRGGDTLGVAFARNGLSGVHRRYLAAGGTGFFIGDGRLNYRPETIYEAFYSVQLARAAWITLDWQTIRNPAYNADRGPVKVGSVRLHAEF